MSGAQFEARIEEAAEPAPGGASVPVERLVSAECERRAKRETEGQLRISADAAGDAASERHGTLHPRLSRHAIKRQAIREAIINTKNRPAASDRMTRPAYRIQVGDPQSKMLLADDSIPLPNPFSLVHAGASWLLGVPLLQSNLLHFLVLPMKSHPFIIPPGSAKVIE